MSSVSQIAQSLQDLLEERADILAKETGFIQRVRTFRGADFAQTLIFGWLQEPQVTLEGLTQIMQRRHVSISGPGLCQRFGPESARFMQRVLEEVTQKQFETEPVPITLLRRFSAVLLEDSSGILLPEPLAQVWQGCGGSPGTSSAALKLFVRWDVLNGTLEGPLLTDGRHSDRRSPLDLQEEADGSLLIADLGFWGVARFEQMARRGQGRQKRRYFLSRLQSGVKLRRRNGSEIVLRGILPQQVGGRVELGAVIGEQRLPVRVLIERVPREVGDQRRQDIREHAQDHGRSPSEEVLYLADWTIVVTNVPVRLANFEEVLILLRLRWQIECLFRLWKEHGHLDESRSQNPWRILTEIYGKLTAMVIQQWLLHEGCWQDPHRSLVKAAQVVRREANLLMRALSTGGLEQVLGDILRCMRSGCRTNTRQQFPSTSQFLLGEPHRWPVRQPLARPYLNAYGGAIYKPVPITAIRKGKKTMKSIFSHLLRISVFTAFAALCLLFVTAIPTLAQAGYAQQTNFHRSIPEQALPGGGGGHGSGGHSSGGHSSSSHSTSSHDTTTDSVSSDSSSSSSSHYYNTHTYTQYNTSSGSSSLDWPTCLTLLVIGAIVLLVVMAWKRRNS